MSKWLEIFLAVIYTQNMAPHKILGFSDNYFYYYIFLCATWDEIRRITYSKQYNFASTSTNICLLGHNRPFGKVWHHFRSFWGGPSSRIINRWIRAEIQLNLRKYQPSLENPKLGVYFRCGTCKPNKKFETNTTPKSIWTTETLITYVYSHGLMKGHMYLREACIHRLCRNGLKFFWQAFTPKVRPHTRS